ncbi:MAG: hypothetical protein ACK52I_24060, partial [Pseudomonadota bacterium]
MKMQQHLKIWYRCIADTEGNLNLQVCALIVHRPMQERALTKRRSPETSPFFFLEREEEEEGEEGGTRAEEA